MRLLLLLIYITLSSNAKLRNQTQGTKHVLANLRYGRNDGSEIFLQTVLFCLLLQNWFTELEWTNQMVCSWHHFNCKTTRVNVLTCTKGSDTSGPPRGQLSHPHALSRNYIIKHERQCWNNEPDDTALRETVCRSWRGRTGMEKMTATESTHLIATRSAYHVPPLIGILKKSETPTM